MPWQPPYREALALPGPWPACAQSLLREGAAWLHTGFPRPGDPGGDILALPGGPLLETRWVGGRWKSWLEGEPLDLSPWDALDHARTLHALPWVGAASFEVCCAEASHDFKAPAEGALGQRWMGVRQAIRVKGHQAEAWGFDRAPALTELLSRFAPACALKRHEAFLQPRWDEAAHRDAVEAIHRRIHDGAFYVANLCVPFEGPFQGDPLTFALAVFRKSKPPYGAFLPLDSGHLVCMSMERLLARRGDRITTEPIKGSAPWIGNAASDSAAALAMAQDPKERAEHTMIVDLLRNDLGKEARSGSVRVESLMAVEPYPTVQHLVSRISATIKEGVRLPDLLRAILPGGSVTGAPKHAVCAHLAQAEAAPRGFYCGALGWIIPQGDVDLCLPIRTAHVEPGRITYWTGGGITRRSDPAREWEELFLKAQVLQGAAGIVRLDQ